MIGGENRIGIYLGIRVDHCSPYRLDPCRCCDPCVADCIARRLLSRRVIALESRSILASGLHPLGYRSGMHRPMAKETLGYVPAGLRSFLATGQGGEFGLDFDPCRGRPVCCLVFFQTSRWNPSRSSPAIFSAGKRDAVQRTPVSVGRIPGIDSRSGREHFFHRAAVACAYTNSESAVEGDVYDSYFSNLRPHPLGAGSSQCRRSVLLWTCCLRFVL